MSEAFLMKLQALRTATLSKRDSGEICSIFKNTLFYWTTPVAVSDSFRFPVFNLKKTFTQWCFSVNFAKISRPSFDIYLWILRSFSENVFYRVGLRNCLFHVTLQNFNQLIQWKFISQVLFKHFIQEREVATLKRSFT